MSGVEERAAEQECVIVCMRPAPMRDGLAIVRMPVCTHQRCRGVERGAGKGRACADSSASAVEGGGHDKVVLESMTVNLRVMFSMFAVSPFFTHISIKDRE